MKRKRHARWLGWLALALFTVIYLPMLKNVALYVQYAHGDVALERVEGEAGSIVGVWEGTFDHFPCGIDTRQTIRIEVFPNLTGTFLSETFFDRYLVGSTMLYSWASLLPYHPTADSWRHGSFRLDGDYAVVEVSVDYGDGTDMETLVLRLDEDGERLHAGFVELVGAELRWPGFGSGQVIDLADVVKPLRF